MSTFLNRYFPGKRARAVVLVSGLLTATVVALAALELQSRYAWAHSLLDEIGPRHARMAGLGLDYERLEAARQQAVGSLAAHAYPAELAADRVGTDLQQRVRQLVDAQGLNVLQSQILPPREGVVVEQVPLQVTVEGGAESLRNLLLAFSSARPSIQVDAIVVQPSSRRAGDGGMRVQLELSAYHLLPQHP